MKQISLLWLNQILSRSMIQLQVGTATFSKSKGSLSLPTCLFRLQHLLYGDHTRYLPSVFQAKRGKWMTYRGKVTLASGKLHFPLNPWEFLLLTDENCLQLLSRLQGNVIKLAFILKTWNAVSLNNIGMLS